MITHIEIEGFKSFGSPKLTVELSPLTFIVGPNASGKTNFVSALRFLRNAVRHDVESAVNELGGPAEVRNRIQRERKQPIPLRIRICLNDRLNANGSRHASDAMGKGDVVTLSDFDYAITIDLREQDDIPVIVEERLSAEVTHGTRRSQKYLLRRDEKTVKIEDPSNGPVGEARPYDVPEQERARPAVNVGFLTLPAVAFRHLLSEWAFFNVSPHVAKQSYRETPDATLGMFGENLSVMLHRMSREDGSAGLKSVIHSLQGVVPGLTSVAAVRTDVERLWALQIAEEKIKGAIGPASVSDGTIRLLTLMVIANLGGRKESLIAIEEPENGVHPHVCRHLIDVFRETSKSSQIIATTHNPAFLDHLEPQEVLMCGKIDGFTKIRRVDGLPQIESFRKHFNLGELWVQGTFDGMFE